MGAFSASDAALSGFTVVKDHWRVLVGWAVFNLMALVAMVIVTVIVVLVTMALTRSSDPTLVNQAVGGGVATLGAIFTQAIMVAGLYRLILRPQEQAFLHLRIGRDEARVLAVWVIWLLACGAIVYLSELVAKALAPVFGPAGPVLALVGLVVIVALSVRVSLVAPLSFDERRIDFPGAWRLTRGQFWPLVGMVLLTLCLLGVVMLGAWLTMMLVTGLATGFDDIFSVRGVQAFEAHPGRYLLQGLAQILFTPVLWVITQAPALAAYQALAKGAGESEAETF